MVPLSPRTPQTLPMPAPTAPVVAVSGDVGVKGVSSDRLEWTTTKIG